MSIFENNYEITENTVVTLGKFDGVHVGHKKLIEITVEEAKRQGYKSLVYTFNQNPRNILKGEKIKNLITKQDKIRILKSMGVDYIVFQDFTYEFSRMPAEKFVNDIIKHKLKAKKVIVGFNYRFGKNAEGDINLLKKIGMDLGIDVQIIEPVEKDGKIISSSLIRDELLSSNGIYS